MTNFQPAPLTPIADALQQLLPSLTAISGTESVALTEAAGRTLAEDFIAPMAVPPYANSAMDGYAVRTTDLDTIPKTLHVSQRIVAGATGEGLNAGEAARIFTGAPLPAGADAVVIQENTEISGTDVVINEDVRPAENLRSAGEDVAQGQRLFESGHRLRPQDIGVLASTGCTSATVTRKLKVALLATGDELVEPGNPLAPGQIYNSNFYSLSALLRNLCAQLIELGVVEDDLESTRTVLEKAARDADCIISTGGVSVGEEDHVRAAVEASGNLDLWKLAIKPGKPFASGKVHSTQFFGLPGNPVSAFITFVLLVRPFLLTMSGCKQAFPRWLSVPAGFGLSKSGERQEYMRVKLLAHGGARDGARDGELQLSPLQNQSSGAGASLSHADGIAIIPPHTAVVRGDQLEYLPFSELIY